MYEALKSVNFFHKICRIIPGLVFLILIQFTLSNHTSLSGILTKLTLVYVVFITAMAFSALIIAIWQQIDKRANKRKLPPQGPGAVSQGYSVDNRHYYYSMHHHRPVAGQAPRRTRRFRGCTDVDIQDSILGIVAGVQLSENDSLHVGDWISVPGTNANGTVSEVGLTAVKVVNWDKTTTTLPPTASSPEDLPTTAACR